MRKTTILSVLAISAVSAVISGCVNSDDRAIDMRASENLVMRIPYDSVKAVTFLVTETKDGYYRLDNKSYTGDLLISTLEKKPFLKNKGVCVQLVRPSSQQKDFIDAMVAMCVERNLNLFIDEPGGDEVTKESQDVDWIVRREK